MGKARKQSINLSRKKEYLKLKAKDEEVSLLEDERIYDMNGIKLSGLMWKSFHEDVKIKVCMMHT